MSGNARLVAELEFVLYTSSFCGACALTRERIDMVAEAVGKDRVMWREINVATDPEGAERDGIDVTPTVVLVRSDGIELMRAAGIPTIEQVLGAIAVNLDAAPAGWDNFTREDRDERSSHAAATGARARPAVLG